MAVLSIVGIGRSLVDGGHSDGCLQLVQLRRSHRVQLLAAHQSVLRQRQQVVAPHAARIRLRVEILTQLRRQQIVEPRRLIRTLSTYQHQDDVVHHLRVDPSCHHRHQPFLQVLGKAQLFVGAALHLHRHREGKQVVLLAVPRRQMLQIAPERMIVAHKAGVDHITDVFLVHPFRLRHSHPDIVLRLVCQRLPCCSLAAARGRLPVFHPPLHHVAAQQIVVHQVVLNLIHRNQILLIVRLVLLLFVFLFHKHCEVTTKTASMQAFTPRISSAV